MVQFSLDQDNIPLDDKEMSSGIKLNKNKSRFARTASNKAVFEKSVNDYSESQSAMLKEGFNLSKKFVEQFQNKTLTANKGPMAKSLEKEIISELTNWAINVNNDQVSRRGMGSTGVIVMILNLLFKVRDSLNTANYKIQELETELANIRSELNDANVEPSTINHE